MRIALDARTIYRSTRRGTGKNLIDLYTHVARARPDWRIIACHRMAGPTPELLPGSQVQPHHIEMPGDRFNAWERFRLPMKAWRENADLIHFPANTCSPWLLVPAVVTIHDLIPLDHPQGRPATEVQHFRQSIVTACRHAAGIICPSQYTRDRLVDEFGADPQRITINHWAADSSVRYVEADQRKPVLDRYNITQRYVLHFGAAAPRKNTRRMIEAWASLDGSQRQDWQLLVVGLDDNTHAAMRELLAQRDVSDSVVLHGFAAEADLPALLSGAEILAFPSLSEGFGLPILDAWATRTCVLTSNRTSLPEVAGDAAVLINPQDPSDIARGLSPLMGSESLRQSLALEGQKRLKQFNWQATTKRFIVAMERAAGVTAWRAAA